MSDEVMRTMTFANCKREPFYITVEPWARTYLMERGDELRIEYEIGDRETDGDLAASVDFHEDNIAVYVVSRRLVVKYRDGVLVEPFEPNA